MALFATMRAVEVPFRAPTGPASASASTDTQKVDLHFGVDYMTDFCFVIQHVLPDVLPYCILTAQKLSHLHIPEDFRVLE